MPVSEVSLDQRRPSTAVDAIQTADEEGDKAMKRAAQAALWALLMGKNPTVAQEMAGNISVIDPTTPGHTPPPMLNIV